MSKTNSKPNKAKTDKLLDKLRKLFGLLGSANEHESKNARQKIEDILRSNRKTWNDLTALLFDGAENAQGWKDDNDSADAALLGFAGLFLAIALLATIGRTVTRRSAERKVRAASANAPAVPSWLLDPRLLAAGLDFGKTLGGRRTIAIGLVGAFLVGL
jgi:ElaB/YqjD/DUF883 family membrane-anchored ribosome-binding protein